MASAFFVLSLGAVDSASARVDCYWQDESLTVSRSDVTGKSTREQSFEIPNTQSRLIINQSVDLNISSDLSQFDNRGITKNTEFIWQVDITWEGNSINDYITAQYQFNGLSFGDNKICSSPSSCIDVVAINRLNQTRQAIRFWGFQYGGRTLESIQLVLDLSNAKDSGIYRGNLQVELFRGSDSNGGDGTPLTCNNL